MQGHYADALSCLQPTLARVSRLLETQKEPKADPAKKLRGKKALALPV